MATQRLTVRALAGKQPCSCRRFEQWRSASDPGAVDPARVAIDNMPCHFRSYTSRSGWTAGSWATWSPGPTRSSGRRYGPPACRQNRRWTGRIDAVNSSRSKRGWRADFREAAQRGDKVADPTAVVVIRGSSVPRPRTTKVRASLSSVPAWLLSSNEPA